MRGEAEFALFEETVMPVRYERYLNKYPFILAAPSWYPNRLKKAESENSK